MDLTTGEADNTLAWVLHNNIVNENGFNLEIRNHAFLIDPFMDISDRIVAMKAAQVGFSTTAILKAIHTSYFRRANIIYTLPSKSIVKDFVIPKVDPLIAINPVIKKMMTGSDSTGLKSFGDRFVYFRSSWDEASGIAISADILVSDEVDRSNQLALRTYRSRLDAARLHRPDLGWEWKFSNPSIPGDGVDVWWQESDQKHWFIKCPHCNFWQFLGYPENINFESEQYVCRKCNKFLSDEDRADGEWVSRRLNKRISGYWFSQLMVPWISASKIIEESLGDQQVFYNFTLGLPYVSKEKNVSREDIKKCIIEEENPRSDVAIGVDVGKVKHFVIGNRYGIFRIGTTSSWDEIEDLRNQYDAYMVIDGMPNPDEPLKLAAKYRGKVFVNYYVEDKHQLGTVRWLEDTKDKKQYGIVESDRTKIFDNLVADIQNQDVAYNLTEFELGDYIFHWQQMFRVVKNKTNSEGANTGTVTADWVTIGGRPDHFCHAHIYQRIAQMKTLSTGRIITPKPPVNQQKRQNIVILDGKANVPGLSTDQLVQGIRKQGMLPKKSWKTI